MPIIFLFFVLISCQNDQVQEVVEEPIITTNVIDSVNIDLTQYAAATHLINPKELTTWQLEKGQPLLIIDARSKEKYEKGHLINAFCLERSDYESKAFPYQGMRLEKEKLAKLLGNLGATSQHRIVLYDDSGNADAARLWWLLSLYGHPNAYILNGGLLNVDTTLITIKSPNFIAQLFEFKGTERPELLATKETVINAQKDETYFLLDCRTPEEFKGEVQKKGAFQKGKIPAAINIEHSESIAYERSTTFRDYEDLKERFKAVPKEKNIIIYCQSGVRSAHTTFVLRELLGYPNVANYDGSWIEWSYYLSE